MRLIAIRLALAFLCIIFFLLFQGWFGYQNARLLSQVQAQAFTRELQFYKMENRLAQIRLTVFKLLGTMDPREMDEHCETYNREMAALGLDLQQHGVSQELIDANRTLYDRIIELHYDLSGKTARRLVSTESKEAHEKLVSRLAALSWEASRDAESRVRQAHRRIFLMTAGIGLAALVTAFFWALVLVRSLTDRRKAEQDLRESEAKYRALIESTDTGFAILDPEGRVVDANAAYVGLAGHASLADITGKPVSRWIALHDQNRNAEQLKHCLEKGSVRSLEMDYIDSQGRITPVEINAAPIVTRKGILIQALCRDIRPRKEALQALQSSEERFRRMAEVSPAVFWMMSPDWQEIVYVSPAFEKIYGLPCEELYKRPAIWIDAVHPEDRQWLQPFYQEQQGRDFDIEYRVVRPDGSICWVKNSISSIRSKSGEITLMSGIAEDVTKRKLAEEALRASEEKFRLIVENQTDLVIKTDAEGRFLFVSPSYCDMYGKTEAELLGQSFRTLVQEDDIEGLQEETRKLYQPPHTCYFERRTWTRNGWRWLAWACKAVLDEQGVLSAVIGVGRDITGQKQARKEKMELERHLQTAQKMEAIGTMAGGIAHDFNNILGVIMGYTEIAQCQLPENGALRSDLDEVLKASERAKDLIQQILTFSRQSEESRKPMKLGLIVKETLRLLRSSIPSTIDIQQDIAATGDTVEADPTQMQQVIMNLCTNAAYAMRQHGGELSVALNPVTVPEDETAAPVDLAPGPYTKLSVGDTGTGIPPEEVKRIFEPYFTTKEKGVGTGLGLATVHGIVKNYGGAIEVQSRPGRGSRFDVYLPRIIKEVVAEKAVETPIPGGSERILLVDDEPTLAYAAGQMLQRLGYSVVTRTSSLEALALFQDSPQNFDLVITDMTMPKITGAELSQAMIRVRPDIPIVLCTGFSELITEENAAAFGIRAYVMKPIVTREIAQTLRKVLDGDPDQAAISQSETGIETLV